MKCSVHGMACFTRIASQSRLLILCLEVRKATDSLSSSSLLSTGDQDLSNFDDPSGLISGKQRGSVSGRMCNTISAHTGWWRQLRDCSGNLSCRSVFFIINCHGRWFGIVCLGCKMKDFGLYHGVGQCFR